MRALQVVSVMARLITTLLVLAWAWSCRSEWNIHLVKETDTTLGNLPENHKHKLRDVELTDEDLDIVLVKTKCLTPCPGHHKPIRIDECYRPLKKRSSCEGDSCKVWYSYTTHCGCGDGMDNIDFKIENNPDYKCEGEVEKNREERQEEYPPEVLTIHIDEGNKRVSSLPFRVCPVMRGERWMRKVNGEPKEAKVGGGVTVAWEDEICGPTDIHGDSSDGDEALMGKLNVTVTSCDSKLHNVSLKNLPEKLREVLKDCPRTSTSTTIHPPIPTPDTKFPEIKTLAKFEIIMGEATQSKPHNNALLSNEGGVPSWVVVVVVVLLFVAVIAIVGSVFFKNHKPKQSDKKREDERDNSDGLLKNTEDPGT